MVPGAGAFFDHYIQYSIYVLNIDSIIPGIFHPDLAVRSHPPNDTANCLTTDTVHIILYINSCLLIPSMVQETQKRLNKLLLN